MSSLFLSYRQPEIHRGIKVRTPYRLLQEWSETDAKGGDEKSAIARILTFLCTPPAEPYTLRDIKPVWSPMAGPAVREGYVIDYDADGDVTDRHVRVSLPHLKLHGNDQGGIEIFLAPCELEVMQQDADQG